MIPNISEYCPQRDWVPDGDRYYRCTACNKRLLPRENFHGFRLPIHKPKGHKIRKIKKRQHLMRRKK